MKKIGVLNMMDNFDNNIPQFDDDFSNQNGFTPMTDSDWEIDNNDFYSAVKIMRENGIEYHVYKEQT